ncbi:phage head spike fiber domain-containing protein [Sorangium sp. So ce131]|uniref:phage head spike fiber domain-containing protein n=1 Tax=Sorangium sp. So ce131 TaxID=3133282 RepID=UPI003F63FB21
MRSAAARRGASTALPLVILAASAALTCAPRWEGTGTEREPGTTPTTAGGEGGADGLPDAMLYGWAASAPEDPGLYELPRWLTLESPTPDKTVQIGERAIVSGIPADVARARRVGEDSPWGLSLEGARENRIPFSTPTMPLWRLYSEASLEEAPGPDGAMSAGRVADVDAEETSAAYVPVSGAVGATSTVSGWVGDVSGEDGELAWVRNSTFDEDTQGGASTRVPAPASAWRRIDFTGVEVERAGNLFVYPAAAEAAQAGAASFAFLSLESARYPSSAIPTTGAARRREADVLFASNAEWLIWKGWIKASIEFAPNYASGEQLADHDLLYIDPGNRVSLRASDGAIAMTITGARGSATLATEPLSWKREQAFKVDVLSSPTGLSLDVVIDGEEAISVVESEDVGAIPVPESGRIHLLGGPEGSQECADLRRVAFYEVR